MITYLTFFYRDLTQVVNNYTELTFPIEDSSESDTSCVLHNVFNLVDKDLTVDALINDLVRTLNFISADKYITLEKVITLEKWFIMVTVKHVEKES